MGKVSAKNKVILITGASSGIGAALARALVKLQAHVVLFARRETQLHRLAEELQNQGGETLVCVGDVTRFDDLSKAVADAKERFGKVDWAFANAGYAAVGALEGLKWEDYQRQFDTNVTGVLKTLYATLEELKKNRGKFILMGSMLGMAGPPYASPYAMSKAAIRIMAECLHPELAKSGVGLTLISAGFIQSELFQVNYQGIKMTEEWGNIPHWMRMPEEVAARKIIKAVLAGKRERILTLHAKALSFGQRFFPGILRMILKKLARDFVKQGSLPPAIK